MESRICVKCGKTFNKPRNCSSSMWVERYKCCSTSCAASVRGCDWLSRHQFQPGEHNGRNTEFKKGQKAHNFKLTGYTYSAVHHWLRKHYPLSGVCTMCKLTKTTQWSNITGKYLRDIGDYEELCYSCHTKKDKINPLRPIYK